MSQEKTRRFKIRDRRNRVLGPFSEAQILSRIKKEKLTGEEWVSEPPYTDWQKLGSHSVFFDALLRRIHGKNLPTELSTAPVDNSVDQSKASTKAPRVGSKKSPEKSDLSIPPDLFSGLEEEEAGKTKRIESLQLEEHPDIKELFEDKPDSNAPLHGDSASSPREILSKPLDISKPVHLPKEKKTLSPTGPTSNRRVVLWAGVLIGALWMLFGLETKKSAKVLNFNDPVSQSSILKSQSPTFIKSSVPTDEVEELSIQIGETYNNLDEYRYYERASDWYRRALDSEKLGNRARGAIAEASVQLFKSAEDQENFRAEILEAIRKGRERDPHSSQFYRTEAYLELYSGNLEAAKGLVQSAAQSDPGSPKNAVLLGEIHLKIGDLDAAKEVLMSALAEEGNNLRLLYQLARVFRAQRDFQSARNLLDRLLSLNPYHLRAYLLLGDLEREGGSLKLASQMYLRGGRFAELTDWESAATLFFRLATVEEIIGESEAAKAHYALAKHYQKSPLSEINEKLSSIALNSKLLEEAKAKYVNSKEYYRDAGNIKLGQKDFNASIRYFMAYSVLEAKSAEAVFGLARSYEGLAKTYEDFKKAMILYDRSIELDPTLTNAYIQLGLLETDQYNLDRGFQLLNQAKALEPKSSEVYRALGKHFYQRKDYINATENFRAAQKLKPNESETLYYAGLLLQIADPGSDSEVGDFFYGAYVSDPDNYPALVEWAKVQVKKSEKNSAIKFISNLIEQEPNNAKLYWAFGEVYASNQEYSRARAYFQKSLDIDNRDAEVRASLAATLQALGVYDKAVAEYRLSALLNPRKPDRYFKAADILFSKKDLTTAEKVLTDLIANTPNYPGARLLLSKIYSQTDRREQAIELVQTEVEKSPRNTKFQLDLAKTYMANEKFAEAEVPLQVILNLPPISEAPEYVYDKLEAYVLIAQCYIQQKKYESAEGALSLALAMDPRDKSGVLHREMGYVYMAMQRDREAIAAFNDYLTRNPASDDAVKIRQIINKIGLPE